ncbi:hypothetical protein SH1V18_47960 [Vallitalea longa]|uniref:MPN domain-containing protein n=1 Tax=Vallitalea longa TaxID=2936439 RepID=A0A9W5YGN1_9FIRM|nr:DNA repair protein RadC [Vallitalea longa]GKX32316.1 hypothetical protein SH1V18_47960 [Vallitalea longa]
MDYKKSLDQYTDFELLQSLTALSEEEFKNIIEEEGYKLLFVPSDDKLKEIVSKDVGTKLLIVGEISKRLTSYRALEKMKANSPGTLASLFMTEMRYLDKEHFKVVCMDTKNNYISSTTVSIGTVNAALANPREVFIEALRKKAVHIVLIHNHPSGDPSPSKEDILLSRRMYEAGRIVGIELLDHIIIGDGKYTSLKQEQYFSDFEIEV